MVSGIHLSHEVLEQVWVHVKMFGRSAEDIWRDLFFCSRATLEHVELLCREAASSECDDKFLYPSEKQRTGGQKRRMNGADTAALLGILREKPETTQLRAIEQMSKHYYGSPYNLPSTSTVCRELQRHDWSRKVLERRNVNQDPVKRAAFLRRMGPFAHTRILDIDETLSTAKEFFQRYGYSPKGKVACKTQFGINGKHFSAICAYSSMGVLAYRVKEGMFDSAEFSDFLEVEVNDSLLPGMVGLFDNAKIHHTAEARSVMERVFGGWYEFSSPYSPDLKPVERLFAMIKQILREREDQATRDPDAAIKAIFDEFRPGQPKACHALNHFRLYEDNHNAWLLY